jgi:Amino acid transporters
MIGMVIMLIIGSNFTYLMGRTSITGGVYSYTKQAFGRDHAFLSSWFLCLSYLTIVFLNGTALFYVIRMLFNDALQIGFHYTVAGNTIYLGETVVSVLVLAAVGILFITAKPALQRFHTVLSILLFLGILITAVFCLSAAVKNGALRSFGTRGINKGYSVFSLVILAPWAFVGFEVTSFDTAHFKFPISKSKGLIILSIVVTAFAYASMALVSVAAVPDGFTSWQEYIAGLDGLNGIASVPTFYAAKSIMGPVGLVIMTLSAVAAILTGIIGGYRATTRVLSTMAEDNILSEKFSKTTYSILFIMVISIVLALLGRNTLNWFVDLTSFGAIVGFGYTSAAAWKVAKTQGNKITVLTGLIGTVISAIFVIVQLIPRLTAMEAMNSAAFLLLALWCLLGFVFYWRTVNHSTLTEYSGMSTSGIVLFTLLIYSSLMWLAKMLIKKTKLKKSKLR